MQFLHLLFCIKVFCLNVKDIDQNMVQEISSYLPVEVHVASNIKVESARVPVFNILKEPLLISNSKWGCFFSGNLFVSCILEASWGWHKWTTLLYYHCRLEGRRALWKSWVLEVFLPDGVQWNWKRFTSSFGRNLYIYIFFILDLWKYPASRYYQLCCK